MPFSQNRLQIRLVCNSDLSQVAANNFADMLTRHSVELISFFPLDHDPKTVVYNFPSNEIKESVFNIPDINILLNHFSPGNGHKTRGLFKRP